MSEKKRDRTIPAVALLCMSVLLLGSATAQTGAPTLAEQLVATRTTAGGGQDQGGQVQQAQTEPQTIQMGMTTDQVQASLGQPSKVVNLGPKQIYVYKDLKVTFLNGRVADVQ